MKKVAAVVTLAVAVTLAAPGYGQDNSAPPDVTPPANNTGSGPYMPNVTLPSGWANPNTGGAGGSVNNGINAEPPAEVPPASVEDNGNAISGNDANGSGWGNSDSNATGGSDNGGSDSSAASGGDTGDSDSSASGADDSAGASDMSSGSGDSDSSASSDTDSDTTSGDSGDSNTDSAGSDTSSSDSGDASSWK